MANFNDELAALIMGETPELEETDTVMAGQVGTSDDDYEVHKFPVVVLRGERYVAIPEELCSRMLVDYANAWQFRHKTRASKKKYRDKQT